MVVVKIKYKMSFTKSSVEALSTNQVLKVFKNELVSRYFEPMDDFAGGTFNGRIIGVEHNVEDDTGQLYQELMFLVM